MYYNEIAIVLRDEWNPVNGHKAIVREEAIVNRAYGEQGDGDATQRRKPNGQAPTGMLNSLHPTCF